MSSASPIPQLYLVPCTCGNKVQVRARQAGDQVTCKCGAVVNVPTIRGLKQLETVIDEDERPDAPRSSWQGPIFSLGLVALFIGAMIFFVTWLTPPANLQVDWQNMAAMRRGCRVREETNGRVWASPISTTNSQCSAIAPRDALGRGPQSR